jgi:hypothetical protein
MFSATRRLERAYRETDYRIDDIVLRIGGSPRPVARVLRRHRSAAFIVAANPRSRVFARAINVRRDARLRADVRLAGFPIRTALARHPAGIWPDEPGILAFGLAPARAAEIGRRWGQNAIVMLRRNAAPALVPLR